MKDGIREDEPLSSRRALLLSCPPLPASLRYSPALLREIMQTAGLRRADVVRLIGVPLGQVKKFLLTEESGSHRPMDHATWSLLLLLVDRHPFYRLEPTASHPEPN